MVWDDEKDRTPFYRRWVFRAVVVPGALCAICNAIAIYLLLRRPDVVRRKTSVSCMHAVWIMHACLRDNACPVA